MTDSKKLTAYLIAKREFYGADTKIGHRCSNIVKLLATREGATAEHILAIDENTAIQIEDLEKLTT